MPQMGKLTRPPTALEIRRVMTALSRMGARAGGLARAASLTPEQRSESARIAGSAPKRPRRL